MDGFSFDSANTINGIHPLTDSFYRLPAQGLGEDGMIALNHERRVLLLRTLIDVSPRDCEKATSLDEIVSILETEKAADRARCYVAKNGAIIPDSDEEAERDEKNQIYIAEIKRDPARKTISLLINRGNPNAVFPAFVVPASNDVEYVEPPSEDATNGTSAHLVISTTWNAGYHRAAFEKMTHVGTSLVQNALNAIVDRAITGNPKYVYQYEVKKGKKVEKVTARYRPIMLLQRMPSEKLTADLDSGELGGITLSKKLTAYGGVGKSNDVRYVEQKIVVHTAHTDKTAMQKLVAKMQAIGKEEKYDSITLHLEKLPHGQTSTPTLSLLDEEDALETLYSRAQILDGFGEILQGCYKGICPRY